MPGCKIPPSHPIVRAGNLSRVPEPGHPGRPVGVGKELTETRLHVHELVAAVMELGGEDPPLFLEDLLAAEVAPSILPGDSRRLQIVDPDGQLLPAEANCGLIRFGVGLFPNLLQIGFERAEPPFGSGKLPRERAVDAGERAWGLVAPQLFPEVLDGLTEGFPKSFEHERSAGGLRP